ncbi:hypothetical protein KSP35_02950 [Aquihabitans sp. G128]|uniref:hypothetical protein n=1 Tax=Aquihabitans sp. G128 TaxID=2849779 RepID=UPI001C237DBF|nr:hypothetical protein [Aquihabitans sp. G128]QXC61811.1 hypothetical protein KSP35_02950 [Aquihabitans sp. G128]
MTQWNPDGSLDVDTPDGLIHVGPKGDVSSGSYDDRGNYTESYPDGGSAHVGPDGDYYEGPDGTRTSYDGDGGSTEIPPPTYTEPPGPPGKAPSGGIGEPHYLTEDGVDVTSQVLGEFLLSSGVPGQQVQARTQPWKQSPSAAAISALAFGVGDQRVQVEVDGTVLVDGKAAPAGEAQQFGFDDGGAVGVWRAGAEGPADTVIVVWPDLSQARVTVHDGWLSFDLQWREATGDRRGVLGSDDGDAANDRTTRDGEVVAEGEADDLVRSWQLTDAESLFTYQDGLHTADYVDDSFPTEQQEPDRAAGTEACAGVVEGFARDACAYDVGLTGVDAWVAPARAFGQRVAGDASLRATIAKLVDRLAEVVAGSGSGDDPRRGDGITLSAKDRAGAADVSDTLTPGADLDGTATATFSFTVDERSTLGAQSTDLGCPNEEYEPGQPGYAFFDSTGTVVSGPRLACDDDPGKAVVVPGTYYVKFVGPGAVGITITLFAT